MRPAVIPPDPIPMEAFEENGGVVGADALVKLVGGGGNTSPANGTLLRLELCYRCNQVTTPRRD
ncbi:MAG: hypothetical protein SGPRY_011822 [Prymnesium sp.]